MLFIDVYGGVVMFYYLMVDPDKKYKCKFGITKNPEQRIKPYRTANPQCYFSKVWDVDSDVIQEAEILRLLKDARFMVNREYIHAPASLVETIITNYFIDNGFIDQ